MQQLQEITVQLLSFQFSHICYFTAEKIIKDLQNSSSFKPWNTDLTDVYIGIGRSKYDMKDVCFHNGTVEFNATFQSDTPTCGRYVRVRLNATASLMICGLEVYGGNGKLSKLTLFKKLLSLNVCDFIFGPVVQTHRQLTRRQTVKHIVCKTIPLQRKNV